MGKAGNVKRMRKVRNASSEVFKTASSRTTWRCFSRRYEGTCRLLLHGPWTLEGEGDTVLRNVGQYLPRFAASHLRKPEPTMTNAYQVYVSISEEEKRNEGTGGKIILTRLLMQTIVGIWSWLDWQKNALSWRIFNIFDVWRVACNLSLDFWLFCGDKLRLFSISVTASRIELGPQD